MVNKREIILWEGEKLKYSAVCRVELHNSKKKLLLLFLSVIK
jgi:hypothetical protein